jgi:hypothetical protein
MVAAGTRGACSPRSGSGGRRGGRGATSSALWSKNSGLQTRAGAGGARGARGGSTAHRHVERLKVFEGCGWVV